MELAESMHYIKICTLINYLQSFRVSLIHKRLREGNSVKNVYRPAMLGQLPTCRLLISGRATNTTPDDFW